MTLFNRGRTTPSSFRRPKSSGATVQPTVRSRRPNLGRRRRHLGVFPRKRGLGGGPQRRGRLLLFISSVSAYGDLSQPFREDTVAELEEGHPDDRLAEDFSNSARSRSSASGQSRRLRRTDGKLRPGLIVGPHDPTGRFTYGRIVCAGGESWLPSRREPGAVHRRPRSRRLDRAPLRAAHRGPVNAANRDVTGQRFSRHASSHGQRRRIRMGRSGFLIEQEVGQWMELPSGCTKTSHQCDRCLARHRRRPHLPSATRPSRDARARRHDGASGLEPKRGPS